MQSFFSFGYNVHCRIPHLHEQSEVLLIFYPNHLQWSTMLGYHFQKEDFLFTVLSSMFTVTVFLLVSVIFSTKVLNTGLDIYEASRESRFWAWTIHIICRQTSPVPWTESRMEPFMSSNWKRDHAHNGSNFRTYVVKWHPTLCRLRVELFVTYKFPNSL